MRMPQSLITALVFLLLPSWALAQTIDAGRGDLPVTVPDAYDNNEPAPLILLLHGYTSNGPRVDAYMGLSDVADDYGFLLVAPEGMRESAGEVERLRCLLQLLRLRSG